MNEWKAQNARVIMYQIVPSGEPLGSALDYFKAVWKKEPDSFQKTAGQLPFAPAVAQGSLDGMSVLCSAQPARVEYVIGPAQQTQLISTLPFIEDASKLKLELTRLFEAVVDAHQNVSINRVGLVISFGRVASDIADANAAVNAILPEAYRFRLSNEEDFILQLNRPVQSRLSTEVRMNFISRWAVDRVQLVTFTNLSSPIGAPDQPVNIPPIIKFLTVSSLLFDDNNSPLTRRLSAREQTSILKECLDKASERLSEYKLPVAGF